MPTQTRPRRISQAGNKISVVIDRKAGTAYTSRVERQHRFAYELVNISRYLAGEARKAGKNNHWRLQSNVVSAVCISYASLEAAYNEFIHINALSERSGLTSEQREVVFFIGKEQLAPEPRQNTLLKFNLLLRILEKPEMPVHSEPFQSANLVRLLRNMLIHPVPSTVVTFDITDPDLSTQQEIVKKLRSVLKLDKKATFPEAILTSECAVWASRSAERFLAEFERLSGVDLGFVTQTS